MGFNENRNMIFVLFKCDYGRGRKSHRDRIIWRQHQKIPIWISKLHRFSRNSKRYTNALLNQ